MHTTTGRLLDGYFGLSDAPLEEVGEAITVLNPAEVIGELALIIDNLRRIAGDMPEVVQLVAEGDAKAGAADHCLSDISHGSGHPEAEAMAAAARTAHTEISGAQHAVHNMGTEITTALGLLIAAQVNLEAGGQYYECAGQRAAAAAAAKQQALTHTDNYLNFVQGYTTGL